MVFVFVFVRLLADADVDVDDGVLWLFRDLALLVAPRV